MEEYAKLGISCMGGCCGTTPEYIRLLAARIGGQPVVPRSVSRHSALCSASRVVEINCVHVIGERINPTGKKLFKDVYKRQR